VNVGRVEVLLDVVDWARAQPMQSSSNSRMQKALCWERQVSKKGLVEYVLLEMKSALRVVEEEPEEVGV
jgi:hypothetical protein